MLKLNALILIFILLQTVKPTSEIIEKESQTSNGGEVKKAQHAKSQPEIESESESESEMEPGMGMIFRPPRMQPMQQQTTGCPGLTQIFCKAYATRCVWTFMNGCINKPGVPVQVMQGVGKTKIISGGMGLPEKEFESESESEMPGGGMAMKFPAGMPYQSNPAMGFEREGETETETENGVTTIKGGGMPMGGGMPRAPAMGGGFQFETETETEIQNGASHTYDYQHQSNMPGGFQHIVNNNGAVLVDNGSGLKPVLPVLPNPVLIDSGIPTPGTVVSPLGPPPGVVVPLPPVVAPVAPAPPVVAPQASNANRKLECLAKDNAEVCAADIICKWDPREICVPKNAAVSNRHGALTPFCSDIKDMISCVDAEGCQWNIHTQSCKIFANMVLRNIRTCHGIARPSCSEYFGCKWDVTQQMCTSERNALSGQLSDTNAQELGKSHSSTRRKRSIEATADSYSDYSPYDPEPEPQQASTDPTYCLLKGKTDCNADRICFWDMRQICLPAKLQLETTVPPKSHIDNFFHPGPQTGLLKPSGATASTDIPNKASFFHPNVPRTNSQNFNKPGAPGQGNRDTGRSPGLPHVLPSSVGAGIETETENESEAEYSNPFNPYASITTTAFNTCFYHGDRASCLEDTDCFWDRRTKLCASLDVPNFLPATCEGFLYEAPCTQDKRCIWKTECEEANLDCEDILTKDRCLRTKYNGIPCIWKDHGQECDEAPIYLQKSLDQSSVHDKEAEFHFLWPVLVIVPFVFIIFNLVWKIYSSKNTSTDLLLEDVQPSQFI